MYRESEPFMFEGKLYIALLWLDGTISIGVWPGAWPWKFVGFAHKILEKRT